ncbi:MAG TPA: carbohydrate ABC transporter permease [Candidatus Bathyarchaeota archaeon]|nr:carbohydrate ABC transporter permease [Candidatus Bathyarchaeota archaeon]
MVKINKRKIVIYVSAFIFLLYIIVPYSWIVITSVRTDADVLSGGLIPREFTLDYYKSLITQKPVGGIVGSATFAVIKNFPWALRNSIIVASLTTLICVFAASLSGYTFARMKYTGKEVFFNMVLVSRMVPALIILIPIFIIFHDLHLDDNLFTLSLVYSALMIPMDCWLLRSYFMMIPREIEEAALIDGCSKSQTIFKIILPLALPGLIAVSIYTFMGCWNELFFALVLTHSRNAQTVPVVAAMGVGEFGTQFGYLGVITVVGTIIPVTMALALQKYIISGLTLGWGKR